MSTLDLELALLRAKIAEGEPRPKFDEHLHPRDPGGEGGGQFVRAGGGTAPVSEDRKVLYGGHAGTPEDPVPAGADLDRAVRIIADGGHVSLSQPDEVATLLDKLRGIVKDAEDKGEKAPTYDLCNVSVPGTNLFCHDSVKRPDGSTIPRIQMPQLSTKDPVPGSEADKQPRNAKGEVDLSRQFGEFLASSGLETSETTIDASHLRASQSELDGGKVAGIAGAIASGKLDVNDPKGRIYVTEDNYVIDGHHRWAAAVAEFYRTGKPIDMPVTVVHTDIGRALTTANFWTEQQGIPPADVTKKAARIDPWLYSVAARTPELLGVVQALEKADHGNAGNASSLIRWFNEGAGGAIAWGSPGDWAQCVAVASAHMTPEQAHGFCQNRHIEATGMSTAEHAHNDGKAFDPNQPRDNEGQWADTGGGLSDADRDALFEQREKADQAFTSEDEEGRKKYQGAPHFDVPAPSWTAASPAEMKSLHDYLKKTNGVLYHGTSREGARDVLANGLQSDQDRGVDGLSEWELDDLSDPYSWDGVYLGKEDRASGFGDVLLAIDMKGMDDRVQQWVDGDALVYGSIPPDRISVVKGVPAKAFDPALHPRDDQGQFADVPGGGNPLAEPANAGPSGEVQASGPDDAWKKLDADRFDRATQEEAHPENYEPNRGYGTHLKLGATEWRRDVSPDGVPTVYQVVGTDARTIPIEVWGPQNPAAMPMSGPDGTPIVVLRVDGSERPDPYVYRVVSVGEFDQARERGYFQSDQSMNLADEGTVTSRGSTGTFYAPVNGEDMRIVQLDMHPEDGWEVDSDGYVKTHKPVPFDRAHAYSTPLANPRAAKAFTETLHPRYPAGTPGGLGGQFMPEGARVIEGTVVNDSEALARLAAAFSAGDAMRDRAARVGEHGLHPGDPVHFISRNDGNYYHGTVTRIDAQGVHVNIPKQYGEHTSGNEDSVKVPEEIRHEADPIEIPPEAPTYTMANGDVIVGPWDPKFPDLAKYATLILAPHPPSPPKVRVLTAPEARTAIREDAATKPPFVVGERVVATTGDVGILMRYGGDVGILRTRYGSAGEGTASIRLDDGRVLADMTEGLQHAGTWETPDGWTAAGLAGEDAHEVFAANDGSGRVYGITYPAGWKSDTNTVAGMREALVLMIDNNLALEADTGLHNAWNGTLNFEVHQRPNVAATKEWSCSITIGQSTVKGMKAVGDPYWNPKDAEDSRSTLIHELSHGLSDSGRAAYRERPGWEEGVVQAYTESYMAVEQFGRGQTTTKHPPGHPAYSKWVKGLDQAMFMAHRGDTYGDRLDWYRELLRMSLSTREVAIDQQMQSAGSHYRLELHGDTWNSRDYQEAVFLDAGKSAGGEEAIRAQIFGAHTVEQANAALDAFESYASKHPNTSTSLRMDAEWLVMFITAHEPDTGAKADFTPSLHPRDTHGRFTDTPGGSADYRATWKPEMTPEEGHAWAKAAGTKIPQTVVHMTSMEHVDGIRGTGFNPAKQTVHEYGRYFAANPETAAFYEYKGDTAVSTVVVAKNPLILDWRKSENISDIARAGEFRAAALEAAGIDPDLAVNDRYVHDDPELTTLALQNLGYDSVSIFAHSSGDEDPTTGGDQLIVFDREQAVVIGTEHVPSAFVNPAEWRSYYSASDQALLPDQPDQTAPRDVWERYWDEVDTWQHSHPDPRVEALDRAFAKDFDPALHPRDDHGRFARSGLGAITAGNTDAGAVGNEGLYNALIGVVRNEDISNEALGPSAIDNAAIRLKTENVSNIGTALAYRAKSDPGLQAQLARAGDRLVRVARGATARMGAPVTEHFDENGRLTGDLGVYSEDHLHLREGMTREEVGGREVAAELQDTWMNTATDSNALSWGLQLAVADRMGITSGDAAISSIGEQAGPKVIEWLGIEGAHKRTLADTARQIASSPAVKAYVDQVYNDTQNYLADNGITEISAYRGVEFFIGIPPESATAHVDPGVDLSKDPFHTGSPDPQDREVTLNPLSSFSTSEDTARTFSGANAYDWPGGPTTASYVIETTFPAERVFSLAPTGPGCLKETEMLVIGGPAEARVTPIEHRSSDPGY